MLITQSILEQKKESRGKLDAPKVGKAPGPGEVGRTDAMLINFALIRRGSCEVWLGCVTIAMKQLTAVEQDRHRDPLALR